MSLAETYTAVNKKWIVGLARRGCNSKCGSVGKLIGFADYEVIGLYYNEQTPWDTKEEFIKAYNRISEQYKCIIIIANSIGAYFAMNAFSDKNIMRAFFISPITNMEKLITGMMFYAGVSENELREKGEISTSYGETLSWKYLCYVRDNPIVWNVPTDILYGEKDHLVSEEVISEFAKQHQARLTIMKDGEHWFHTEEQTEFMDNWLKECLKREA